MAEAARSARRRRSPIVVLAAAMLAGLVPAVAATAAAPVVAAAQTSVPCTGPYTIVPDAYVLPAWSDSAGWSRPDQFESIVSGDIDGDGKGELVGRGTGGLEIFTWADPPPSFKAKAYNPDPGQWRQILPLDTARTDLPSFNTLDGWWDPSWSSTFRLVNLDSTPADELVVRTSTGLAVHRYDPTLQAFGPSVIPAGHWTDDQGWGQSHPSAYRSITTGQVDGRPGEELVGAGPNGVEVLALDDAGTDLVRVDTGPPIMVGWDDVDESSTMRLGNFDGAGVDELALLERDGLHTFRFDGTTRAWVEMPEGLNEAWTYGSGRMVSRFEVGDIDGNGTDDVIGANYQGFDAETLHPDGWRLMAPLGGFAGNTFAEPQYGDTVQLADVLPAKGLEVIGRRHDGLVTYALQNGRWWAVAGPISHFSDAQGFGTWVQPDSPDANVEPLPADFRYATIQPVSVHPGEQVIIGRGATGVHTFHADGTTPTAGFAPYTDLHGVPIQPGANPNISGLSPEGRAYWYVSTQLVANHWSDQPTRTLLDQFHNTTLSGQWATLHQAFIDAQSTDGGTTPFDPGAGELQAMNVPRGTYNAVLQDLGDWTLAVDELYTHLFDSEAGLQSLVDSAFIANAGQVDQIKEAFESDPALMALFADLLWGFLAVAGSVAFAFGAGEAAVAAWAAVGSIVGSGVAGGMGFSNPNGAVDTEADKLKDEIEDSFCATHQFFGQSFDQIVSDYGLLVTNEQMVDSINATLANPASNRTNLIAAMNKTQDQWIWQQFANRTSGSNMWVGWCDSDIGYDCPWSPGDPNTWTSPEDPSVAYRLIGELVGSQGSNGNCHYDVLANNSGLADLKPDLAGPFSPRQTDTASRGQPLADGVGTIGTLGWRLGSEECDW